MSKEIYYDICVDLKGDKYKEAISFGFPFLSRHKSNCRKDVTKQYTDSKDYKIYEIYTVDRKENGEIFNICKNCGYKINASYHFEEDKIIKITK